MSHVFISYKREDLDRVAPLVTALRDSGVDVWWDQDIPPGGSWRETIVEKLDGAGLCVAIWSETSTGPAGRFVREEAERSARRAAYIGLLIDPVPPPFGFSEWQAIDLSDWNGSADDPQLLYVVETVRARLDGTAPPAADPPKPKSKPKKDDGGAKRRLPLLIGGGALVAAGAAALLWFQPWASAAATTPTAFITDRLTQADCTWASIGEVNTLPDGEHVSLKGIAPAPEAIQASLLREATANQVKLGGVQVHDLAVAPPEVCAELQLMKPYRAPPSARRLTIVPLRDSPRGTDGSITFFEFELNTADLPPHAALLGLDNKSGIKVEVDDLHAFLREPPRRRSGNVSTYLGGFDDEGGRVRNVGLVLMTSRLPIDKALVEAIGTDNSSSAFLQRVDEAAKAGDWQFELALVRCGFEGSGENRRC